MISRPTTLGTWPMLGAVAMVAAVICFAVVHLLVGAEQISPEAERRRAITAAATDHAEELLSLDGRSTHGAVAALRSDASGEWAEQLGADVPGLVAALRATGRVSEVQVDAIAVVDGDADGARVLVVASSTVADGRRSHRRVVNLELTMAADEDGWKVARVEVIA